MAQTAVRIINPGHGPKFTSPKKAIKYVKEGRAVIAGDFAIRFVESDRRHIAVLKSIAGEFIENNPAPQKNLKLAPVVPFDPAWTSTGTNEYATFGRYPMFPQSAFKAA
jgi:hypothetical protein